jgi:hypothetical protein
MPSHSLATSARHATTADSLLPRTVARRWQVAILSAATAIWLLASVAALVARERDYWPVMEASLFSWETSQVVEPELIGTTRDGRSVAMVPAGFGLQPHQLEVWLRRRLGTPGERASQGKEVMAFLAHEWNRRHPVTDAVRTVVLRLKRVELQTGHESSSETFLVWWMR